MTSGKLCKCIKSEVPKAGLSKALHFASNAVCVGSTCHEMCGDLCRFLGLLGELWVRVFASHSGG